MVVAVRRHGCVLKHLRRLHIFHLRQCERPDVCTPY